MQDMQMNPRIKSICEKIKNETWTATQELAKGGVKLDHSDVAEMVQTAMVIKLLEDIYHEMFLSNAEIRSKMYPNSIFGQSQEG